MVVVAESLPLKLENVTMQHNYSLQHLNTFHFDAIAKWFLAIKDKSELIKFFSSEIGHFPTYFILGGGSNVLFSGNYEGLIIHLDIRGKTIDHEDENYIYLRAQAGEDWDQLVEFTVSKGWGGLENLSLIPGRVGACPIQNIGAYGVEVKDAVVEVEYFDLVDEMVHSLKNDECAFEYRNSVFKNKLKGRAVILSVLFRLTKKPVLNYNYVTLKNELQTITSIDLKGVRDAVIRVRRSRLPDPDTLGNAGSFFKNPVISATHYHVLKKKYSDIPGYQVEEEKMKVPAAFLIETCGWKGKRMGNVGVHQQQPLVLVNYGGGTGNDVLELAGKIKESVKPAFDIDLEMEVNIVRS